MYIKRLNELREQNETIKVELEEKPIEEDNPEVDNQEQSTLSFKIIFRSQNLFSN
jgi:hypothetical protein